MGTRIDEFLSGTEGSVFSLSRIAGRVNPVKVKPAIDVTQRRTSVDEVIQRRTPLEEVRVTGGLAAGDFVKGMSHELHTPLHVIIGLCQLLERDRNASLSAGQRDAVERMERNARNLLLTVNHLLVCLRTGHFE